MRWVFIGIVVLNVLYLGMHLFAGEDAAPVVAEPVAKGSFPATLRLVGEPGGAPAPLATEPAPAGPAAAGCPAVGPFADEGVADSVVTALDGAGFEATARDVEVPSATVFWVFLPVAADREQALRRLRELHARGIESFVVASGADANAISLGTFQSRDSALGVQSRMTAAGYPAEIRPVTRNLRQQWVVLTPATAQGFLEHIPPAAGQYRLERLPCGR